MKPACGAPSTPLCNSCWTGRLGWGAPFRELALEPCMRLTVHAIDCKRTTARPALHHSIATTNRTLALPFSCRTVSLCWGRSVCGSPVTPRSGVTGTARPTFQLPYRELVPGRLAGWFGTGASPNFRTLELPNFRTSSRLRVSFPGRLRQRRQSHRQSATKWRLWPQFTPP
jgi:hypothetical protein